MSLVYEIPQGSKIHFGNSARLKRKIEALAVRIFYENGFEEIQTPMFSFENSGSRETIKISTNNNKQLFLRNDNTNDVIKIIHRHLGGRISNKKWFYIQSAFSYPSTQINQIGAECMDNECFANIMCLVVSVFLELKISPILQISNTNIPRICASESGLSLEVFSKMHLDTILKSSYLAELLKIERMDDLKSYIAKAPSFLKDELEQLLQSASYCHYENTIFSPLYYPPFGYYDGLFFRMFNGNKNFVIGGKYEIDDVKSCGFAIYTDEVVEFILNEVEIYE